MTPVNKIINAMTVDVEDYFQVSAFEGIIPRQAWEAQPSRVERNTERILELFARTGTQGTFFVLGWIAERFPGLVRRIVESGHELASHGYDHTRVTGQTPAAFRKDVSDTRAILEDTGGCAVSGFRAASFSINASNLWAFDELREAGYLYSSSIYPIHHDLYGMPDAPRFPFRAADGGITEVPISTVRVGSRNLPCGGGGYFRLLPYPVSRYAMRRVNRVDGRPCIFYFHPWELDDEQPRQPDIPVKTRFRHYVNLSRMERRIERLLADFSWGRMDRIFVGSETDGGRA